MKLPLHNPRILCCASIFALSLSACTHHPDKPKVDQNLADYGQQMSNGHSNKLKKGYRTNRLAGQFPDPRSYDNLWDRLFDRFDLPEVNHPDVDKELSWFINHPTYIERVQSRAEPFLYSIVKQLEKNNMPGELALLPVIESAFQPHVVSPAHAAGIWQFIPATGRHYGLKQSNSYDGRRDIYASTRAAIKYLKKLHNDFNGDWLLAIAGYNCGEGAVARAIQKNLARGLPTDFWSLDLPHETRSYVPRLLAVAKLFGNSEQYSINLRTIPNKALYKTVVLKNQVDLALAANAAEISLGKLFELNPGFKRQYVDVNGSYRLFIPAHKKIVDFKQELARQIAAQGYDGNDNSTDSLSTQSALGIPLTLPSSNDDSTSKMSTPVVSVVEPKSAVPIEESSTRQDTLAQAQPQPVQLAEEHKVSGKSLNLADAAAPQRQVFEIQMAEEANAPALIEPDVNREEKTAPLKTNERMGNVKSEKKSASKKLSPTFEGVAEGLRKPVRVTAPAKPNPEEKAQDHSPQKSALSIHEKPDYLLRVSEHTAKKTEFRVKDGEPVYPKVREHDEDVKELKKTNHIATSDVIKQGQKTAALVKDFTSREKEITRKETGKKAIAPVGMIKSPLPSVKHTAQEGETLFAISKRFNVSVADLRKWNGIKADSQFRAGMNITVSSEKD